jgi:hypothetical protein
MTQTTVRLSKYSNAFLTSESSGRHGSASQGNRIKKRGHPERSAARAKAGRHGVEGSRESSEDHQTRPNIVPAFHGILRLRDARHLRPPGIAPPQNDPVFFDAIALARRGIQFAALNRGRVANGLASQDARFS